MTAGVGHTHCFGSGLQGEVPAQCGIQLLDSATTGTGDSSPAAGTCKRTPATYLCNTNILAQTHLQPTYKKGQVIS